MIGVCAVRRAVELFCSIVDAMKTNVPRGAGVPHVKRGHEETPRANLEVHTAKVEPLVRQSVEKEAAEIVDKGSAAVAQQGGPPKTFDASAGGVGNGVLGFRIGGAMDLKDVGERASRASALIDAVQASGKSVTGATMSMKWFEEDWAKRGAMPVASLQGSLANVFLGVLGALTSSGPPRPLVFPDDLAPRDARTPMWLAEMRQRVEEVGSFVKDANAQGLSLPSAEHSLMMLEPNLSNPISGESFVKELELNLLENLAKDLLNRP